MARPAPRIAWGPVVDRAADIVDGYSTGVTLRQLYYRLVAAQLIPNTDTAYKTLSRRTAEARRAGWFPRLIDQTRGIEQPASWEGPSHALRDLVNRYRRDRTEGQACSLFLGVEKRGLTTLLRSWFDGLGLPVFALGGYASQTLADEVAEQVEADGRPAVLIYAGDFDPTGEDIPRDFIERVDVFSEVLRIALTAEQVEAYGLPPQPGKVSDSRAAGFVAKHGRLVQVELDALAPEELRRLYEDAISDYWDVSQYRRVLDREAPVRQALAELTPVTG